MAAIRFCGCSVTGFNCRLGLGGNKSSMDINVYQDPRNGDFFVPPPLGTPAYFTFGPNFRFWGLLTNWQEENSTQGLGLYSLRIEDPRDLLSGVQVILGNYNGSTYGVANILNVYGFMENVFGYGGSSSNEGGMLWTDVLTTLQGLTNSPQGDFGGPIQFRGVSYALDLSNIPIPPAYYRVGGTIRTLLDLIQQVCDDGGCDMFVELDPGTIIPIIRIYTINRYAQPPLGTIALITQNNWGGTLVRSNHGIELRSQDPNSHFLIGGDVQTLFETTPMQPFWGYDLNGLPIVNQIVNIPGLGITNGAWVNAAEIQGCLSNGASYYFLTEFEMRAVLDDVPGSWEMYVQYESAVTGSNKANIIGPLGLKGMIGVPNANPNAQAVADFLIPLGANQSQIALQEQVKDFIKRLAQQWYGRKYWVALPFVLDKTDPTNLTVSTSYDVSDGGWTEGGVPLGLYVQNQLKFMQDDGRFEAMAVFNPAGVDLENVNPEDSALQDNGFFTKLSVDRSIYTWPQTGIPAVVVTLNSPVSQQMVHIGGDLGVFAKVLQQNDGAAVWKAFQGRQAFGAIHFRIAPPRIPPFAVAIALKSNISTYGPWYYAGPMGKVNVEQASDLTPWEYGSTAIMNLAGFARVTSAVTFMQVGETGRLELMGLPITSLGGLILANGPNITGMEVRYGPQGITTSYDFRTYTELHLNRYISGMQERLKRLGRTQNELRKAALLALQKADLTNVMMFEAANNRVKRLPKWMAAQGTPHPVVIASTILDPNTNRYRTSTALADPQEAWTGIGGTEGDNVLFRNSSLADLSSVIRPFYNISGGMPAGYYLPRLTHPIVPTGLNQWTYNPYEASTQNDIEYLVSGNTTQQGQFVTSRSVNWSSARPVGLTMPMFGVGWGVDMAGDFTPFAPTGYKAGPMDFIWDNNRGVWTMHDLAFGRLNTTCMPYGGSSTMQLIGAPNGTTLTVTNLYSTGVPVDTLVTAGYNPYTKQWMIISADCGG
jgi:hypothetical protein